MSLGYFVYMDFDFDNRGNATAIAYGPEEHAVKYSHIIRENNPDVAIASFETDILTANNLLKQSRERGISNKYVFKDEYLTDYLGKCAKNNLFYD